MLLPDRIAGREPAEITALGRELVKCQGPGVYRFSDRNLFEFAQAVRESGEDPFEIANRLPRDRLTADLLLSKRDIRALAQAFRRLS